MLLGIAAKEIDLFPDITLFLRFRHVRSKQKKEQSLATWFIWQNFASVPVFIRARSKLIKIWGPLTRQFLQRNTHQEQRFWHTFLCRFARSFGIFYEIATDSHDTSFRRFSQFGMIRWALELSFCLFENYKPFLILCDIGKTFNSVHWSWRTYKIF